MHFARDILVRAVKTDSDYQELQDALSLMGYDDPSTSPCGQMMSQQVHTCTSDKPDARVLCVVKPRWWSEIMTDNSRS